MRLVQRGPLRTTCSASAVAAVRTRSIGIAMPLHARGCLSAVRWHHASHGARAQQQQGRPCAASCQAPGARHLSSSTSPPPPAAAAAADEPAETEAAPAAAAAVRPVKYRYPGRVPLSPPGSMPRSYDEYSNEALLLMASGGDHNATCEILVRDIMLVDEVRRPAIPYELCNSFKLRSNINQGGESRVFSVGLQRGGRPAGADPADLRQRLGRLRAAGHGRSMAHRATHRATKEMASGAQRRQGCIISLVLVWSRPTGRDRLGRGSRTGFVPTGVQSGDSVSPPTRRSAEHHPRGRGGGSEFRRLSRPQAVGQREHGNDRVARGRGPRDRE